MNEKKNARPSLATQERAVAKQRINFTRQCVATVAFAIAFYLLMSFGVEALLKSLGLLP